MIDIRTLSFSELKALQSLTAAVHIDLRRKHMTLTGLRHTKDGFINPYDSPNRRVTASVWAAIQDCITNRINGTIERLLDLARAVDECLSKIDRDHAEALEINHRRRIAEFFGGKDCAARREALEAAHAEALEINEAIDAMIEGRQAIADNKPDAMQETWELVRLGNSYKEAGRDWYRWAKSTAIRLWETSTKAANEERNEGMKVANVDVKHPKLFTQYAQWLGRQMTEGRELVRHACPACKATLFSMTPPIGDCSDTLANCPVCDALYFRIVDNENGQPVVAVHTMPASAEGASHA
ncbi:hypothetical protein EHJ13_12195 [Cronobacter dublinensis]|uniref:Uncharacterized protein n=1 Tax=Cronobacter dublinensis TaxID=413497 RepID=A0A9Q4T144_9ENTR|nr:hypothetical protein [Cronobacter dublinensis]NCH88191.1 hypothetical protein [Cronobacter dublinensis]